MMRFAIAISSKNIRLNCKFYFKDANHSILHDIYHVDI